MARYIDAEKLKHILNNSKYYGRKQGNDFADMIAECEAEDVAPIKRGEWIEDGAMYRCSNCGNRESYYTDSYCRVCGAKMDT